MSKVDSLRRFLFPCFSTTTITSTTRSTTTTITTTKATSTTTTTTKATSTTTSTTTKKRLSTSLRDDIPEVQENNNNQEESSSTTTEESVNNYPHNPPRSSKSMVIGTFFGHRRGHVCFCIQHDRLHSKPSLLLELSLPTYLFVKEMKCGLVRIALECNRSDLSSCPLHSIPIWTMCIDGRKVGFASKRRATDKDRLILKTMKSMTVGAGVIPAGLTSSSSDDQSEGGGEGEVVYMRANYERVIGSADSESFHLVNPDGFPGHELSVFLLRSTR
ncbi:Protein of unknown function DUF617 [Macleaya cordata]|uniref:Protein MIZU-KUSSEI 1 n=1 Tax=Macleaya cordata TaxID=56857 RepID=A0A200R4Y7_MACCD|nr:Protein of unknown function DUF617 [Macleaya cordata]